MKTSKVTAFALAAGLFIAGSARAEYKNHPGTMCQRWGSSTGAVYYGGSGLFTNNSLSQVVAICPIVHSAAETSTTVQAWVLDQNPNVNIRCVVQSYLSSSLSYFMQDSRTNSTNLNSSCQPISFAAVPVSNGRSTLTCYLPPKVNGLDNSVCSYRAN